MNSSGTSISSSQLGKMSSMRTKSPDKLIDWNDLLPWQKDNEYILTSYRPASFSVARSFWSIFRLHNETLNIWTHLLGALIYSLIPLDSYPEFKQQYTTASFGDIMMLGIFFSGVTVCFAFSTFHHAFLNHSKEVWQLGLQLDHLGIVLVMWSSMVPSNYFGFYCSPQLLYFYNTIATASALGCAIFTMKPHFRSPTYRVMRSVMFALLGLSAFVPVIHGILLNGWEVQNQRMAITYFLGLGLLNATGTVIYAARVPEKWYPKSFDVYGSSHQIMHVLVACGALSHAIGLLKAFDHWDRSKSLALAC